MRELTYEEVSLVAGGSRQGDMMIFVGGGMVAAGKAIHAVPNVYTKMIGAALMTTGAGVIAMGEAHNRGSDPGSSPNPPGSTPGSGTYPAPPEADCDEGSQDGPNGSYVVICHGGGGTSGGRG